MVSCKYYMLIIGATEQHLTADRLRNMVCVKYINVLNILESTISV